MMVRKGTVAILLFVLVISGCTFYSDERGVEEKIHLRFYTFLNPDDFREEIELPIKQKFPDIQLDYVHNIATTMTTRGPDLLQADIWHRHNGGSIEGAGYTVIQGLEQFPALDLLAFVTGDSEILRIDQQLLMQAGWSSKKNQLNYLPYTQRMYGLFYDKQAFLDHNIRLPVDGMTWWELIELGKTIPYGVKISFDPRFNFMSLAYQQSLPLGKSDLDEAFIAEKWREIIHMIEGFHDIGNPLVDPSIPLAFFLTPQRLLEQPAANPIFTFTSDQFDVPYRNVLTSWAEAEQGGKELDVVSYPVFVSGHMQQRPVVVKEALAVNDRSLYRHEAFQVIEHMVSEEFQLQIARKGLGPVQLSEEIITGFGAEVEQLRNKNFAAFFYNQSSMQLPMIQKRDSEISQDVIGISRALESLYRGEITGEEAYQTVMQHYGQIIN